MSKEDIANKLEQREARRTQSVVSSLIGKEIKQAEPKDEAKKKGRPKANRETKKRITFTILQSQYEQASKIAYVDGKSVSEVVGDFLSDYVKKNRNKIEEYDKLIDKE